MVRDLDIRMKWLQRIKLDKYDCLALVDGQPGAGNTPDMEYDIVIDHHPKRSDTRADLLVIEPHIGVTATILTEWLLESGIDIPTDLATAVTYAIASETQDLGRETTQRDLNAYITVFARSSMRKLAGILHPRLPHSYYLTLNKTLQHTTFFRNIICAVLGNVPNPEMVSEMADFLLRRERTTWTFCIGRFKDALILSVRTSHQDAKAYQVLQKIVGNSRYVGGHDTMAGGQISTKDFPAKDIAKEESQLIRDFMAHHGYEKEDLKPLLESSA